jgi:alpha-L-fucosidase 2
MLVQSRFDVARDGQAVAEIEVLPALPSAWPDGSVRGLRSRGGFEVSELSWTGRQLASVTLSSASGGSVRVRCGSRAAQLAMQPGERVTLGARLTRLPARAQEEGG